MGLIGPWEPLPIYMGEAPLPIAYSLILSLSLDTWYQTLGFLGSLSALPSPW